MVLWLALVLPCLLPVPAAAQATGGGAVVLQLRPRPGDTLRLRIEQTIEMAGPTRSSDDSSETRLTTLMLLARLAVESADAEGATVLAHTDSVRIESNDPFQSNVLQAARALQGERFRFRVAPDGATRVSGADAWAAPAVGSFLSQLPATLPREAVAPGGSWTRTVEIPLAGAGANPARATLTATFRLDSLSRAGDYAYLSLQGRLIRSGAMKDGAGGGGSGGGFVQTSGSVTGHILIDRRRGWIVDARTVTAIRSLVTPRSGSAAPVRMRSTITQWMRVM